MSSQSRHYSDEHLNAFIDNQLDKRERAELLDILRNDIELSNRVCELQKVRSLIQLTYQSPALPESRNKAGALRHKRSMWAIAASVLLVAGILLGWFAHQKFNPPGLIELAEQMHINNPVSDAQDWNLMLHVSTPDPYRLNTLLDEAESLLHAYSAQHKKLHLEILTNGKGLELVNDTNNAYRSRLQQLQSEYPNLSVLACNIALKRLQQQTGNELPLSPGTRVIPSAMQQIIKRQKEGWTYIHI